MSRIEIKNLTIEYKKNNKKILSNANLQIEPGEIVLLTGKNGTGKSTILKTLIGIESIEKNITGAIHLLGSENIFSMSTTALQKVRSKIAYLDQKDDYEAYADAKVIDRLLDSYLPYIGERLNKNIKLKIESLFYEFLPKESKITLKSKLRKLSGGQQRLVSIIADIGLRKDADLFIIDEPLNNLDTQTIKHISNMFNKIHCENPNATFIIVSHCKIFPFINKNIVVENQQLNIGKEVTCYSCFGEPNKEGYYEE